MDGWQERRLSELVNAFSGVWGDDLQDSIPAGKRACQVLRVSDIKENLTIRYGKAPLRVISDRQLSKFRLRSGDIIVVKSSGSKTKVVSGRCVFFRPPDPTVDFIPSNFTLALRAADTNICSQFVWHYLLTDTAIKAVHKMTEGSTYPNLKQAEYLSLPIPFPPLPEQKKIAAVLAKIQRAVELQEAILANVRELKKSLMHRLFTHGLRGERLKETKMGKVPVSWEVIPFSQGVAVKQGQVDPTQSPFSEMLHIGSENIESGTGRLINFRTNKELGISSGNYHFTPDDVLYSKIRPYLKKAALPNFEGTCSADMYPLKAIDNQFHREFLFHLLLGDWFSKEAVSFQERTGIPKINRAQLGAILLPKPPLPEQVEIAHILQTLDEKIAVHESKKSALQDLFKTTLNQLMTGAVRVKDLDIGTSEVEG